MINKYNITNKPLVKKNGTSKFLQSASLAIKLHFVENFINGVICTYAVLNARIYLNFFAAVK